MDTLVPHRRRWPRRAVRRRGGGWRDCLARIAEGCGFAQGKAAPAIVLLEADRADRGRWEALRRSRAASGGEPPYRLPGLGARRRARPGHGPRGHGAAGDGAAGRPRAAAVALRRQRRRPRADRPARDDRDVPGRVAGVPSGPDLPEDEPLMGRAPDRVLDLAGDRQDR